MGRRARLHSEVWRDGNDRAVELGYHVSTSGGGRNSNSVPEFHQCVSAARSHGGTGTPSVPPILVGCCFERRRRQDRQLALSRRGAEGEPAHARGPLGAVEL